MYIKTYQDTKFAKIHQESSTVFSCFTSQEDTLFVIAVVSLPGLKSASEAALEA